MRCMERASLEEFLSQGLSLAEIGKRFDKHEATVAYWVKKYELRAVNRTKHTAKGGLERGDLVKLVDAGA
jgi:transposase